MFNRVLIANRGEIALRVMRACRELNIETVAVYSKADADALYLRYADESICIGRAPAAESYLDIPNIIAAAEVADVAAIHPGYGFLSENAHFAEICRSCHIGFIGPTPEAIKLTGDKTKARELAKQAGIPVVPGSEGTIEDEKQALKLAQEIGYPVMIKAAHGGGGRGMRVAHNDVSLASSFLAARAEAQAAFKDGALYLERLIERPRHVEIQVLGDKYGSLLHLGERDCTIQRRHQKLIEESPSPALDEDLRRRMGEAAVAFARAAGYSSAGTVEFLLDDKNDFYFIEMNARIQVEHPVTECVTGIDLVVEQIRLAAGAKLELRQEDIKLQGHAIECRINAEDPSAGFRPSPGKVKLFVPPGGRGVRVDTHVYSGYSIPPYYDSLLAKVIVHRSNRRHAIRVMRRALEEMVVEGPATTIPLFLDVLSHNRFMRSEVDTGFIEEFFAR